MSPEDLFDSWLVMELVRGADFLGECHVDMGRVSLDDRPVWFPFSSKGSSSHRGSISQIINSQPGTTTPSARELARRLRMRGLAASQSQSGNYFPSLQTRCLIKLSNRIKFSISLSKLSWKLIYNPRVYTKRLTYIIVMHREN